MIAPTLKPSQVHALAALVAHVEHVEPELGEVEATTQPLGQGDDAGIARVPTVTVIFYADRAPIRRQAPTFGEAATLVLAQLALDQEPRP